MEGGVERTVLRRIFCGHIVGIGGGAAGAGAVDEVVAQGGNKAAAVAFTALGAGVEGVTRLGTGGGNGSGLIAVGAGGEGIRRLCRLCRFGGLGPGAGETEDHVLIGTPAALEAVGGKSTAVEFQILIRTAVVGGVDAVDVEDTGAFLLGFQLPETVVILLAHAQTVARGGGGQVGAVGADKAQIAVAALLQGEHGSRVAGTDLLVTQGHVRRGRQLGAVGNGADQLRAGHMEEEDLVAVGQIGHIGDQVCDVSAVSGAGGDLTGVGQRPLGGGGADTVGIGLEEFGDQILDHAAFHVLILGPDRVLRGIGGEGAVAQMIVVDGHEVGLAQVEGPAVGKLLDDHAAAGFLGHIIGEVQAVEDRIGEVVSLGAEDGLTTGGVDAQALGGVEFHDVLDLLAGQGHQIKGVVVAVELVDVLHGHLAGLYFITAADNHGGGGDIHRQMIQTRFGIEGADLLGGVVFLRHVEAALGNLGPVDQVHGVALSQIVVANGVPGAGQRADSLADIGVGGFGVGLDLGFQRRIGGIGGQGQILVLLELNAAVGDGEGGAGQVGAAAVDDDDIVACLVFILVAGVAGGMVVAGDNHVDALGVLDHREDLILGVFAEFNVLGIRTVTETGMVSDNDEVGAVSLGHVDVALSLPGHGTGGVVRVGEDDAGIVVSYVPAGAVGVFKADDGDPVALVACGDGLQNVRREDVFALGVDAVGAVIVEVGSNG